jgi:hypothetical protein
VKKDWLKQLHEDHDVSKNDFLFTDWMPAITMVIIILLAFAGDSGEMRRNNLTSSISECEFYEGEIVSKESGDSKPHTLFVVSNIGNYAVYVTETTYDSVEVNDNYSGLVCNSDSVLFQFFGFLFENRPQIIDLSGN